MSGSGVFCFLAVEFGGDSGRDLSGRGLVSNERIGGALQELFGSPVDVAVHARYVSRDVSG